MKQYKNYLILLILGILTYGNTLNHGYVLDDNAIITNHSHVQKGFDGVSEILTTNYLNGVQNFNDGLYRPLSPVLFAIQNQLSPNNSTLSHFFNILLIIITSWVMYQVGQKVFRLSKSFSLGLAMVFLVLPVHTEVGANIKSADELLALLFVLSSLLFFSNYFKSQNFKDLIIGALMFFVGLFAKENVIQFVVIIPLVLWGMNTSVRKPAFTVFGVTAFLGAVFMFLRNQVLTSMPNEVDGGTLSGLNNSILATEVLSERIGTALSLQFWYVIKTFIPYSLQHDYSFNTMPIVSIVSFPAMLGLLTLMGLAYALWYFRKKSPLISIGIFWYGAALIIVSNLIFPIGATFAERFLYAPSFGLLLAAIGILQLYYPKMELPKTGTILGMGCIALFALISINRNADWKDDYTLFSADYTKLENSARGNYNYGSACQEKSTTTLKAREKKELLAESIIALNRAIEIYPSYLDAYNNLSLAYQQNNEPQKSIETLNQIVAQNATYQKGWYNLGVNYFKLNDYINAKKSFTQYNSLNPNNASSWYFAGMCYGHEGDFESAITHFEKSIQLQPSHMASLIMLGKANGIVKNYNASILYFERALQIEPNNQEVITNLQMTKELIANSNP